MSGNNFISGISGPRKLADRVYLMIEQAIISHELKPGEEVTESSLAERLETSATPIREAISRLIAEGLMEKVPNKPPRVIKLDQKEVSELYSLRSSLETLAVTTAMKNITPKNLKDLKTILAKLDASAEDDELEEYRKHNKMFHDEILKIADNRFLKEMMYAIQQKIQICVTSTVYIPKLHQMGQLFHKQIVELLQGGDVHTARTTMFKYYEELIQYINDHYDEIIV